MLFLKPYFSRTISTLPKDSFGRHEFWLVQQGAEFKSTYHGLPAIYAPIAVAATHWPSLLSSALLHLVDWLTARVCLRSHHGYLHKRDR